MSILPIVTLRINRKHFSLLPFHLHFLPTKLSELIHRVHHTVLHLLHLLLRISSHINLTPTQKWPAHMNLPPTQRKPPPPRNRSPKLANLGSHVLQNLENHMNIMNSKNNLGKFTNKFTNILGKLGLNKNTQRKKGRREYSLAKSHHPSDREWRMILQFTEIGLWRQFLGNGDGKTLLQHWDVHRLEQNR